MREPEIKNAKINKADIQFDRGTFLCAWLDLDYDHSGQGFGGWVLLNRHLAFKKNTSMGDGYGIEYIGRLMDTLEVEKWSDLQGTPCRAMIDEHNMAIAVGHYLKDKWFFPEDLRLQFYGDK